MKYFLIILLTVILGASCGYFQYWMATRLSEKRWLLLLQPGLLAAVLVCFTAWTLSIKNLPAYLRLSGTPFAALLACTAAGWVLGNRRRGRP